MYTLIRLNHPLQRRGGWFLLILACNDSYFAGFPISWYTDMRP